MYKHLAKGNPMISRVGDAIYFFRVYEISTGHGIVLVTRYVVAIYQAQSGSSGRQHPSRKLFSRFRKKKSYAGAVRVPADCICFMFFNICNLSIKL
jgi:hypothetical protein